LFSRQLEFVFTMVASILVADLDNSQHCRGLIEVLDSYASEPAGGGAPLAAHVRENLIPALRLHPTTLVLLARYGDRIVGAAVCFLGFSTFQARPLLNIHDLAVLPECRGRGTGRQLLQAAQDEASRRGCCKLTLEVQDGNDGARRLYASFGFVDFELGEPVVTRILSKVINVERAS
jgi:ribosomal protein S18 acetylase RimI-like enzyme